MYYVLYLAMYVVQARGNLTIWALFFSKNMEITHFDVSVLSMHFWNLKTLRHY